jgi:hypothetical protein
MPINTQQTQWLASRQQIIYPLVSVEKEGQRENPAAAKGGYFFQ